MNTEETVYLMPLVMASGVCFYIKQNSLQLSETIKSSHDSSVLTSAHKGLKMQTVSALTLSAYCLLVWQ